MPGDLIMREGLQTEEIRAEDPLEPDFFFKNQAGLSIASRSDELAAPKANKPAGLWRVEGVIS